MNKALKGIMVSAILTLAAAGSEPSSVGEVSGGWTGWSMNLDVITPPVSSGLERGEYAELLSAIQSIGMLFRRMPSLNPAVGVEVSPSRAIYKRVGIPTAHRAGIRSNAAVIPEKHPLREWPGAGYSAAGAGPVRGEFSIGIYRPEYNYRNPSCSVRIQINDPWLEGRYLFSDEEGGIYITWPSEGERNGRLRYLADRNVIIEKILPAGRDPWLAVSQERWIRTLIAVSKQTLEERRSKITDESSQRRQRFNQGYERMKTLNAEQAETMRKNFESTEEIYARHAAAIAAADYDALEAAGERGLAMVGRHLESLKEELAGLSAAERRAPAYGFEGNPQQYWMPRKKPARPSMLMNPGDSGVLPLLSPDPGFFRRDIPAGEIQSITIINRLWDEYDQAMNAELDWPALRQMVK